MNLLVTMVIVCIDICQLYIAHIEVSCTHNSYLTYSMNLSHINSEIGYCDDSRAH